MHDVAFTPAATTDVPALLGLIEAYYAHDAIAFDAARVRRGLVELIAHPALGGAWTVREGGSAVGYFVLTFGFDLELGGRQATVTDLYLVPTRRRAGLGRATLLFVEETLRGLGIGAFELQAERGNADALAFYRRLGLRERARVPFSKEIGSQRDPGSLRGHEVDA